MVINRQQRIRVAVKPLEAFARRARRALGLGAHDLSVCLVSDAAIARMNRAFRGKHGPTDVLSFPANGTRRWQGSKEAGKRRRRTAAPQRAQRNAGETASQRAQRRQTMQRVHRGANGTQNLSFTSFTSPASYLGDVAVSPETALRNARRLGRGLPDELCILILHGMLHLAGYDHEVDHGEMDRLERRLQRRLGLS